MTMSSGALLGDLHSPYNPTVYVVDDDPELRESLAMMIGSMGLNVESYSSAEAFLDGYHELPTRRSAWCWTSACRA